MVWPNGPFSLAHSGSTCIGSASSVAAPKLEIRSWSIVTQADVPTSCPGVKPSTAPAGAELSAMVFSQESNALYKTDISITLCQRDLEAPMAKPRKTQAAPEPASIGPGR